MKNSTLKILEEIRRKREWQAKLTKEDLEREYQALAESGFPTEKLFEFESNLAGSNQIEYHFVITLEDMKRPKGKQLFLDDSFARRGKQGWEFLFPLLDVRDETDVVYITRIIALCFKGRNDSDTLAERQRLVPYLIRCTGLDSAELRQTSLITLGWVYAPNQFEAELDCLLNHLRNDEDSLCRSWSASALMQLSFHRAPTETIKEKSLPALTEALRTETDVFATGVIIDTIHELWNKNFRLSNAAVERRDAEAVERARKSALRYLERIALTGTEKIKK